MIEKVFRLIFFLLNPSNCLMFNINSTILSWNRCLLLDRSECFTLDNLEHNCVYIHYHFPKTNERLKFVLSLCIVFRIRDLSVDLLRVFIFFVELGLCFAHWLKLKEQFGFFSLLFNAKMIVRKGGYSRRHMEHPQLLADLKTISFTPSTHRTCTGICNT